MIEWFGGRCRDLIEKMIEAKMREAGEAGVAEARSLVPKVTGFLESTITYSYDSNSQTLQISAGAPYASVVELGNSRRSAHPFLRPAMGAVARVWGGNSGISLPQVVQSSGRKIASIHPLKLPVAGTRKFGGGQARRSRLARRKGGSIGG